MCDEKEIFIFYDIDTEEFHREEFPIPTSFIIEN